MKREYRHQLATAGAFVLAQGRFVFMVGPTQSGDRLGVVRLGGHVEEGETGPACAVRELMEEASMAVHLFAPPVTYFAGAPVPMPGQPLPTIAWPESPAPLLVTERADRTVAALYLAISADLPVPAAEAKGLLIPDRAWLSRICTRPFTLAQYLAEGGRAILRTPMPQHLVLEPSTQVRLFDQILQLHPEMYHL